MLNEEDLLGGRGLEAVVPRGCRVLYLGAWNGKEPTVTIREMPDATRKRPAEIHSFTQGKLAAIVQSRIGEAGKLKQLAAGHFELRFLSMPEIQPRAVHLVCKGTVGDLLQPILSDPALNPAISRINQFLSQPELQPAVKLISQATLEDLILPVLSGDPRLSPLAIFKASDFLRIARQIATERAARTRSPLSS